MRIAMFMPGLDPHTLGWRIHLDFAAAVTASGHTFELLTTEGQQRISSGNDRAARVLPVPAWSKPAGSLVAPLLRTRGLVPAAAALVRHLRLAGDLIDVLHVEVAYPFGAAAALAVMACGWNGHLAITPMGEDVLVVDEASYGFRRYLIPRILLKWTLRRATCIRCISPLVEKCVAPIASGVPRRVIPLNVSSDTGVAATETEEARASRRQVARARIERDFDARGRRMIMALGRLHPFKGLDVLVKALAAVPRAVLLIVGPSLSVRPFGDMGQHLLRLSREHGVEDRVRLVGTVPLQQSLEMLAAADVVAVPSYLESLNKVCIEAAAVGTPFVVTDTTGISAWVADSGAGRIVPPHEPAALASALRDILEGRWRPDRARSKTFVRRFQPERIAAEVVDFYQAAIESAGGSRSGDPE